MLEDDGPVDTFVDLGLTYLQAKVYIALLKFGDAGAEVRNITWSSEVARPDVYRLLPTLEKRGLVEKIVASPTRYRAIPIKNALSSLLTQRKEDLNQIQTKVKNTLEKFNLNQQNDPQMDIAQFIITSERKLFFKKVKEDIKKSREVIDIIYSNERLATIFFNTMEHLEKAMKRGIKIQAITDRPKGKPLNKNIQSLQENPHFELKYIEEIPVGLVIFDNKEVNIRTAQTIVPSLWTNNRNVAKLAQVYFETLWQTAKLQTIICSE